MRRAFSKIIRKSLTRNNALRKLIRWDEKKRQKILARYPINKDRLSVQISDEMQKYQNELFQTTLSNKLCFKSSILCSDYNMLDNMNVIKIF